MKHEPISAPPPEGRRINVPAEATGADMLVAARTLWRGKLWLLFAALALGTLGWGWATRIAVPQYTARATLALENRQDSVIELQSVVSGLSGDQATINTEVEVLRSRGLIGQLVDELALTADPEFNPFLAPEAPAASPERMRDATINRTIEALDIANLRASYVFTLAATTTDPDKSARIANTLGALYIADQQRVKAEAMATATAWLSERVATLKGELQAAEAAVKGFAAESDLVSPEAVAALNVQIKDTRDRLADLRERRVAVEIKLAQLDAAEAAGDRIGIAALLQDAALTRLAGQSAPEARDRYAARSAALRAVEEADILKLDTQVASLGASLAALEASYGRQSADLVAFEQLEREAQALRAIYQHFLARLQETSVQQGIQQPDSRMLSHAVRPGSPSAPHVGRVTMLATLFGLVVGAGLVLLREAQHSGFRTADELERDTGLTVMGQLPRIPARKRRSVIDYLVEKPTSAAAEAVRNLRTSVLLADLDRPPQVILSTSSVPGEGKTTTAIGLAQNFAGLGKTVLLIEGDIRRRVFAEYFDFAHDRGLLSILSGTARFDEVVHRIEAIGADVLLGEKSSTNAADVFSSARFASFIEEMRTRYDVIIIDTPPVLLVPDSRIVAHSADAVLFTVKWDATSRAQVREAVRQFAMSGIAITGAALNQIDPKGMRSYGYGGSQGAYAAYGDNRYYDS